MRTASPQRSPGGLPRCGDSRPPDQHADARWCDIHGDRSLACPGVAGQHVAGRPAPQARPGGLTLGIVPPCRAQRWPGQEAALYQWQGRRPANALQASLAELKNTLAGY